MQTNRTRDVDPTATQRSEVLLADVAQRKVDRVLVWKLDRAFRSTLHALATLRDFEHAGVGFSALTQPELDTTSATGRLVFTILAAVAEMERELIADRVREGMRHAARQGKRIGRPLVTARPAVARRWRAVRAEVAAGRLSRRQAARRLGIGTATLARLLARRQAARRLGIGTATLARLLATDTAEGMAHGHD
jgi:DNA invertase Pin-like site-specific DNA recombinase